jgi:hypothetical protein
MGAGFQAKTGGERVEVGGLRFEAKAKEGFILSSSHALRLEPFIYGAGRVLFGNAQSFF